MHARPIAGGRPVIVTIAKSKGEKDTTTDSPLGPGTRLVLGLSKVHYIPLTPWIVYTMVPFDIGFWLRLSIVSIVTVTGLIGVFQQRRRAVLLASSSLIATLILSKILIDLSHLPAPDTAVLLLQFVAVLFLMEMSLVTVQYERDLASLRQRDDALSKTVALHLARWLRGQLSADARLGFASFIISLGLLVLGGLASFQIDQLSVLAVLVFGSVVALLFLLTNRREPEASRKRIG